MKQSLKTLIEKRHIHGLSGSILFVLGDEDFIHIDSNDGNISFESKESDCTIKVSEDDMLDMLTGQLDPVSAYMTGKIEVSGDMSIAMQLQSLLT